MSIPRIPFGIFLIPGCVLYSRHASCSWRDKYPIICQVSQGFCSSSQPPKGSLSDSVLVVTTASIYWQHTMYHTACSALYTYYPT